MTTRYWIIVLLIGSAFGASFAFNEVLRDDFGALTISALRVGLGALGCWLWIMASRKQVMLPIRKLAGLFVLGAFQFAI
ncbi:EamA/RhaT family transporter, partial [Escherichia coli]|nr:EamA/RhaT family transporter [Escherichia coli]